MLDHTSVYFQHRPYSDDIQIWFQTTFRLPFMYTVQTLIQTVQTPVQVVQILVQTVQILVQIVQILVQTVQTVQSLFRPRSTFVHIV